MTIKNYLENTYNYSSESIVLKTGYDSRGHYLVLESTIFYPQGGGQPSDIGAIQHKHHIAEISHVVFIDDEIRHYTNCSDHIFEPGMPVELSICSERRILNARYHTAAHLLGNIVEKMYPNLKAIKGHSFPSEAYVGFNGDDAINLSELQDVVNKAVKAKHIVTSFDISAAKFEQDYYKLPYDIPNKENFRAIKIGCMKPVPCGGTHVSSTHEIGSIILKKAKYKQQNISISYEVV